MAGALASSTASQATGSRPAPSQSAPSHTTTNPHTIASAARLIAAEAAGSARASQPALTAENSGFIRACPEVVGRASCLALERSGIQPVPASLSPNGIPSGFGYGPAQLQAAYNLTSASASNGTGRTIAVVDAYDDPSAASDLFWYRKEAGLPPANFLKVNQNGATFPLPSPAPAAPPGSTQGDWTVETSLDLDMASAICPLCNLVLVEAKDDQSDGIQPGINLYLAQNTAASFAGYISDSWAYPEFPGETSYDSLYFSHGPGVVTTAASGDWDYAALVHYPAASPNVVSVGGTRLSPAANARGWTESVWNDGPGDGTGSGCSSWETQPSWQTAALTWAPTGCTKRVDNDVAADADIQTGVAVYDTSDGHGGWGEGGGTSAGSPMIAAMFALAGNAGATPAQDIYQHTGDFYDVTSGNDGSCSPAYLCTAGPGYDGPTGIGTPNGIAGLQTGGLFPDDFAVSLTSTSASVPQGGAASTTVSTSVASGTAQTITLSASGVPTGAIVTFNPPSVTAGASSTATITTSSATPGGPYSIIITGAYLAGTPNHSATFTLFVGDTNTGTYYPLPPQRILDTRLGLGAARAPLGPGGTIGLQVSGQGGVPTSGVSAVVLNVTATNPTAASYVTVYPDGGAQPNASSLNVVPGWTGANSVTVGLGATGAVDIYNNAGTTDMIADVVGFYATDSTVAGALGIGNNYDPIVPKRFFDSRDPTNPATMGGRVPSNTFVNIPIDFGPSANPHIRAVVVNATATSALAAGYLSTWSGQGPIPPTSTLNYTAGGSSAVPNMAIVPVTFTVPTGVPSIAVYTSQSTHVILDLMGVMADSGLTGAGNYRFTPMQPVRIADTRRWYGAGPFGQGTTETITAPSSILTTASTGLALNVTATGPTAYTYVSVWPAGIAGVGQPLVSNLNPSPGQTVPNSVYSAIGPTDAFNVYNNWGTTDIIVDVVGAFWNPAQVAGASATRPTASPSGLSPLRLLSSSRATLHPAG
jgi:hypothetical protein